MGVFPCRVRIPGAAQHQITPGTSERWEREIHYAENWEADRTTQFAAYMSTGNVENIK